MGKIKLWAGRLDLRIRGMASAFAGAFWNWIFSVAPPGVAAGDAFDAKPRPFAGSVDLDRFDKVLRARRNVSTTGTGATELVNHRGEKKLVKANQFFKNPFHFA